MIKRLVFLFCCILLLPTIAAAEGTMHYGDWWVGGQVGGVFTADTNVTLTAPDLFPGQEFKRSIKTDASVLAGAIAGYNFCMPYRQAWERYFGLALDFQWNQFNHPGKDFFPKDSGNQFALSFLGRLQYPFMGSDMFTRGRLVPFLMFGPAVVWTNSHIPSDVGSVIKTTSDFGIVAEAGLEFFIIPQLSIGPSFRYRHVWGPTFKDQGIRLDSQLNQYMVLGRLAWHF